MLSLVRPTPVAIRFNVLPMGHSNWLPVDNTSIGTHFLFLIWFVHCIPLSCSLVVVKNLVFFRKLFLSILAGNDLLRFHAPICFRLDVFRLCLFVICVLSQSACTTLLISVGTIPASKYYIPSTLEFLRQPVTSQHVSFSVTSICFEWVDLPHTGDAYPAIDRHRAIAVVLNVCDWALPTSFRNSPLRDAIFFF